MKTDLIDIKKMDVGAITKKVVDLKAEIADLVIEKHTNKLKDTSLLSKKRRMVALMLTIVRQKQLLEKLEQMQPVKEGGDK